MVKNTSIFQLTGKKLKRKENTSTTLTIIQKDISLDGCGLKNLVDSNILIFGSLNQQEETLG